MKELDPRRFIVEDRLKEAKKRALVISAKGGVGKTTLTASLGLRTSAEDLKVGLIDADLYNPNLHVALGLSELPPFTEEEGIIAPEVRPGLGLISIAHFAGDEPLALRGAEATDALIELLAVTRWRGFDLLLVDTPPGMGETLLNVLELFPEEGTSLIVVTRPDELSMSSLRRLVRFLVSLPEGLSKERLAVVINCADENVASGRLEIDGHELKAYHLPELRGERAGSAAELVRELSSLIPDELVRLVIGAQGAS